MVLDTNIYPFNLLTKIYKTDEKAYMTHIRGFLEQIQTLRPRESGVLKRRYLKGSTPEEIAEIFDISVAKVHAIEKKAIGKMSVPKRQWKYEAVTRRQYVLLQEEKAKLVKNNKQLQDEIHKLKGITVKNQPLKSLNDIDESHLTKELLELPIESLEISSRIYSCLVHIQKMKTVRDIINTSEKDLLNIRGFGEQSLKQLKVAIHAHI